MTADSWMATLTDTEHLLQVGGLLLLLLLVFLETGVLLGIVLPGGDYMLFTAGLMCGTPYIAVPLWLLLLLLWIVAVAGDITGYYKGRWLGPKLFDKSENRFFKPVYLYKTKKLWVQYGVFVFIIGRFLPIVRTLIPMMAGASRLKMRRFILFDVIGGALWVGVLVSVGYWLGRQFPAIFDYLHYVLVVIVISASFPIAKMWWSEQNRRRNKKH